MAETDADLITASDAAKRSGYTKQHIIRLIKTDKLAGRRVGQYWVTTVEAVEAYKRSAPKPGRPPGGVKLQ